VTRDDLLALGILPVCRLTGIYDRRGLSWHYETRCVNQRATVSDGLIKVAGSAQIVIHKMASCEFAINKSGICKIATAEIAIYESTLYEVRCYKESPIPNDVVECAGHEVGASAISFK
jgi:hypothetical protein